MANHKSAIKRIRQTETRSEVNRANRSALRTQVKKFVKSIEGGTPDKALLPTTVSEIDKAVRKGIIKKGKADRMKSRLSIRLNKATVSN
jgi:small subunit ribosomal protein S20